MRHRYSCIKMVIVMLLLNSCCITMLYGQAQTQTNSSKKFQKASRKIEIGIDNNNPDTLARGYLDLGDEYYQNNELEKSEASYLKAKNLFVTLNDAEGVAKSSRLLARVQEDLHKNKEALKNYNTAQENNSKTGDIIANRLNKNDISRLLQPDSVLLQQRLLLDNINLGIKNNDSNEVVNNYSRMAEISLRNNLNSSAAGAYTNAYNFSKNKPGQALKYNQLVTDAYVKDKNFAKAIETKKLGLNEAFVQNSTQLKASETTLLAEVYLQQQNDSAAIRLLKESYHLSVQNGHTIEAKKSIEKLDSIYQSIGHKEKSLAIYKQFLAELPGIMAKLKQQYLI